MLKEIQERSLGNHSWLPALDPPGSTMCAAGDTMGSLQITAQKTAAGATNLLWAFQKF